MKTIRKIQNRISLFSLLSIVSIFSLLVSSCGGGDSSLSEAEMLLSSMTLQEKVDQVSGGTYNPSDPDAMMGQIVNDRLNIPSMLYRDGPRGAKATSSLIDGVTTFPVAASRASAWDTDLEERIGQVMGKETRAQGAYVLLAPTINQVMNPLWGRSQETYGEDTFLLGKMGAASIRGIQMDPPEGTYRVQSCVKHFAANNLENNRKFVNASMSERTLREVYLPHFKMAVDEGNVSAFMGAYNQLNGSYACTNYHLLWEILREEWGFKGYVITDWYARGYTKPSMVAGLDVEMPFSEGREGYDYFFYGPKLKSAVEDGLVSEDLLDAAVLRILNRKSEYGMFDYPAQMKLYNLETADSVALTLEAARKGTVLLKNDGILPLDKSSVTSIVLLGEFANLDRLGDIGSSNSIPSYAINPTEGLKAMIGDSKVTSFQLATTDPTAIANADYVIVVCSYRPANLATADAGTDSWGEEGEAKDRSSMALPDRDIANINAAVTANPGKVIVLIESGGAVFMPWLADVNAVIMAWYPGMTGGQAIAEILFGDVNPSGKLCQTFPMNDTQLPYFPNASTDNTATYNYYHGYRYFDKQNLTPLFWFGYGLSYTTYSYSNLTISDNTITEDEILTVSVDVANTGSRDGDEIVQLYVGYSNTGITDLIGRPVKELKGFKRVSIPAGETRTVEIEVKASDLSYYDPTLSSWVVEKMQYEVFVGPSADPANLDSANFTIE